KLVSQWNCGQPSDAHSIDVGDQANHSYAVTKTTCTATKSEVGGVKEKEGIGTQFNETMGDTTTWHGVFVVTAENGDKIHYTYASAGKGMVKDGQFQSGSNKWSMVGGTGKFASAKGEGSCQGKGSGADLLQHCQASTLRSNARPGRTSAGSWTQSGESFCCGASL